MSLLGPHADQGLAGNPASPVHRLDGRAKVVGLLGITVVAVTTPLHAWPVWVACVLVLATLALVARVPASTIARRARPAALLLLGIAVFAPLLHDGGQTLATTSAKAAIGTVAAVLLGATTRFADVLRALELLRVPRALLLIAAVTERYLHVLVDEVRRMRTALAARGHRPRNALQVAATGRVAGALFLRAHARGERVHLAMLARGHRGAPPLLHDPVLTRADVVFVAVVALCVLPLRVLLEIST